MPFTVITLSKVPPHLRGDLTKWMQEIDTGVFIGNFNSKVREKLWKRVTENVGDGNATLSFHYNNEQGYSFEMYQTQRVSVDFDGIQLVKSPLVIENVPDKDLHHGFSNASKFNNARKFQKAALKTQETPQFVVMDIETEGLNSEIHGIIEIGAIKIKNNNTQEIQFLINTGRPISDSISQLTQITDEMLINDGILIEDALKEFLVFIDNLPIVGFNVDFDFSFVNKQLKLLGMDTLRNKKVDLLRIVKKEKMFLKNYRLDTVIAEYGINEKVPHRALEDANLIYLLSTKVNGFHDIIKKGR